MNKIEYNYLEKLWIINWCWAKWWFNFSNIIDHNIKLFEEFKQEFFNSLHLSIKLKACWPHDVRFYNWWFIFAYIWANLKFAYDVYKILDWTCLWNRMAVFLLSFFWLMIWWIKAFNWCFYWNKKNININK